MNNNHHQSSPSSQWNDFVSSLEIQTKIYPIQWNHNRELIMLDIKKKSSIFLKEILHYDCDDPLKMIDSSYHTDKYNIDLLINELSPLEAILKENSFDLIIERQEKLEIVRKLIDHYLHFIVDNNFASIMYELHKLNKTESLLSEAISQSQYLKDKMNQIKSKYVLLSIKIAMKKQKMKNLLKMIEFFNNHLNKWVVALKDTKILKKNQFQAQLFNKLGNIKYSISTWTPSNPITIKRNLLITDVLFVKLRVKMEKVQINFNNELKTIFCERKPSIEEIYELFCTLKTVQFQNPYDEFITNILSTFKLSLLSITQNSLIQESKGTKESITKFSQLNCLLSTESKLLASLPLLLKNLLVIAECYNSYMLDTETDIESLNSNGKQMSIKKILYDKRELFCIVFEKKLTKVFKSIFSSSKDKLQSSKNNFLLMISYISLFSESLKQLFFIAKLNIIKQFIVELIKENIQSEVRLFIKKNGNMLSGDNWKRLALRDNDEIFTLAKYEIHVPYKDFLSILKGNERVHNHKEATKTLSKLIENPSKYSKERIELDILSKPLSNLKIIHSSSSYSVIKSILELITNNILYGSLSKDIFDQIFNLFDYYILATLTMRMIHKSYLLQIFQTVNIEETKKKNALPASSQFAYFLLSYSSLRMHLNKTKKNLSVLFNMDIDPIAKNYHEDTNAFFLPKLNNQISMIENNFYSLLIESIVLVESIISIYKYIKRLDQFITDEMELNKFKVVMDHYKTTISQLRSFLYKPICGSIFNIDAIITKMLNQKWEFKENDIHDFSNASSYIDQLHDDLFEKYDKLSLLSGGSITPQAQVRFFDVLISYVIERLIDSISQIKKSNSTGRSILLKDMKIFKARIEESILQMNNKRINYDKYFNKLILYINSWYYTEEELIAFIKDSQLEFKHALIIVFSGNNFEALSKKEKREVVEKVEGVYYDIIENINKKLISD